MRSSLSVLLSFSLLLGGCLDWGAGAGEDLGEGVACAGSGFGEAIGGIFAQKRRGEADHVMLSGLCSTFERCNGYSPLMRGSEFTVALNNIDSTDSAEPFDVASSDPSVLSSESDRGQCNRSRHAFVAEATGNVTLTSATELGDELDRFELEVAEATTLSLAQAEPSLFTQDGTVIVVAAAQDAEGRELAMGYGNTTWSVEDNGVLVMDDEPATGAVLMASPGTSGTAIVRVSANGLEAEIVVTVP